MAGERIGPAKSGILSRIMQSWFGGEGDAVAEKAAAESPEFNARMKRQGFVLPVDMVRQLLGDPGPNDVGGPSDDVLQAVTKFATKADRIKALEKLDIGGNVTDSQRALFEWLKAKYPRVMAHNNRVGVAPLGSHAAHPGKIMRGVNSPTDGIQELLGMKGVANITVDPSQSLPRDFLETLSHELTHTAQRLGLGSRAEDTYQRYNQTLGYELNPLELGAQFSSWNRLDQAEELIQNLMRNEDTARSMQHAAQNATRHLETGMPSKGMPSVERRAFREADRIPADWDERVAAAVSRLGDQQPSTLQTLRDQLFAQPRQDSQKALTESTMDFVRKMLRGE